MTTDISITAIRSISPLGHDPSNILNAYRSGRHFLTQTGDDEALVWAGVLPQELKSMVNRLRSSESRYRSLDESVLFAILAARAAVADAGWSERSSFGINIGSSRGATTLFEQHHAEFMATGKARTLASPVTTLGNISSWVSHDLQSDGPEISHSITCSTSLHAMLNGIAWLRGGMADKFLVGGSEAPLTPFTIAQMQAMKIYSKESGAFPCLAGDFPKTSNTMVLGEGASICCLETGVTENALALVKGIGYATELLEHSTSISAEADCFVKSMSMACEGISPGDIDVIVMHAPGTIKGDRSEYNAICKLFGDDLPMLTTNKWLTGHTFGSSGMLSIEMAILMLQQNAFFPVPFMPQQVQKNDLKNILVNSVGFGGNAVSILISRV
jgi:3-oxoacyl-(acyl-carrier-protein) synthase